jgi:hypothetical protein
MLGKKKKNIKEVSIQRDTKRQVKPVQKQGRRKRGSSVSIDFKKKKVKERKKSFISGDLRGRQAQATVEQITSRASCFHLRFSL